MAPRRSDADRLLTTGEVAPIMRVDIRTVSRWAKEGWFPDAPDGSPAVIRTLGGIYRIRESVVRGILDGTIEPRGPR